MIYDAAIIGAGPAGISAALNLKIHGKSLVWFDNHCRIARAEHHIINYPGFPDVSEKELQKELLHHIMVMGLTLIDTDVDSVVPLGRNYGIQTDSNCFEARTVLFASGILNATAMKGEREFVGRGVSYCPSCDGIIYRGKTIAIIITSPHFEQEANYLACLAGQVLLFAPYKDCGVDMSKVAVMGLMPKAIEGTNKVEAVRCLDGSVYPVDAVFCLRDSTSQTILPAGLQTEGGTISVNRAMETNLHGVYAAGDCTGHPYQYAKAVGEGNIAAYSMLKYLASKST